MMHDRRVDRRAPSERVARTWLVVPQLDYVAGVEQHVANLAVALAAGGTEVTVVSVRPVPGDSPYRATFAAHGIRCSEPGPPAGAAAAPLTWPDAADPDVATLLDDARRHWPGFVELEHRFRRLAATGAPDVVHVHGFRLDATAVALLASAAGHPAIYTEHSTLGEADHLFGPISDLAWAFLSSARAVSCVSSHTREVVAAVVPDGVRVERARHVIAQPRTAALRDRDAGAALRAVCLSRLVPEKGVDGLVEAALLLAERHRPIDLVLAGAGPDREALRARLQASPAAAAHARLLDGYEPEELDDVLAAADVAVLPSRTEGLPVSIVEAFARGVPVVATAVGGTPELVADGVNGRLVPAGDAAALADVLDALAADPGEVARLSAGAAATYVEDRWAPEAVAEEVLELYAWAASSSVASERTAATPRSQVYRSWYSRLASSTRRLRS
jgi:glycosyltransferase involved in cell wall biosynthesis